MDKKAFVKKTSAACKAHAADAAVLHVITALYRLTAFALALIMLLSLFSCNNPTDSGKPLDTTDVQTTAVLKEIDLSGYKIVRPTGASEAETELSIILKKRILEVTGADLKLSDDYIRSEADIDATAKEILVGNTTRPQSEAARTQAGTKGYAVTFDGTKIAIYGSDVTALSAAVDCFTGEYLTAAFLNGTVLKIPDGLNDVRSLEGNLLDISVNGEPKYTIIRSDDEDLYISGIVSSLHDKIETLTGGDQKIKTDLIAHGKEYDSDTFEILVGNTKYSQSAKAYEMLGAAQYGIIKIDSKIVVTGKNRTGIALAVQKFEQLIETGAKKNDSGRVNISLLYTGPMIYTDDSFVVDIPEFKDGKLSGSYDCGNGVLEAVYSEAKADGYNKYKSALDAAGYALYAENSLAGNLFSTYSNDNKIINVSYIASTGEVRVITEKRGTGNGSGELFPKATANYTRLATPSVTQLALSYTADSTNGMCYVITLPDGSFIIYDSGFTSDAKKLYDFLCAQNKQSGKPVISAWIITHMHGDHVQGFKEFASAYGKSVDIKYIITNAPAYSASVSEDGLPSYYSEGRFATSLSLISGEKVIKPHSGQVMEFAGARLEILYTHEDLYPKELEAHNDASTVTRLTLEGQTLFFFGDAQTPASDTLCAMYGDALKSDIVQISHHGSPNGATQRIYMLIAAKLAFFPGSSDRYSSNRSLPVNSYIINNSTVKKIIVADPGNVTLTLPTALD